MKFSALLVLLTFATSVFASNVEITGLPLQSISSTGVNDVFPFVNVTANVTKKAKLSDLVNLPALVSTYAPLVNPTFTGAVTSPSFVGTLTGNASTATALAANPTDCGSNSYAVAIDASGNLTCAQVTDGGLSTAYIKADGSRSLTGNWNAGSFTITANSLGLGSAAHTISGLSTIVNSGTLTLPTSSDTLVGRATTDTLTNKTLTSPVISTIVNSGTLTLPSSSDTLVGRATTDTLTNKTLTSPVISQINNSGTLTLPTGTDTLVGRATTDTLTNKSISGSTNTLTNIPDGALSASYLKADGSRALTGNWSAGSFAGTFNSVSVGQSANTIAGVSTLVNGSGTLTLPTTTDTLVGRATTDTLTNKTLTSPTITGTGAIAGTFTGNLTGNVTGNVSGTAGSLSATLPINKGGTGQTTANAAFTALSPMTTTGDMEYSTGSGVTRLPIGSYQQVLSVSAGLPVWTNVPAVTSVGMTVPSFLSVSGSPVTSSGTLAVSLSGTALPAANGGTGVVSTATFPTSGTVVTETATETLTNKTLTNPVINNFSFSGNTMSANNTNGSITLAPNGTGYFKTGGNSALTYPSTGAGVAIGDNFSNDASEVDFFNVATSATDAFDFYQQTGSSAATKVFSIDPSGNSEAYGNFIAANTLGVGAAPLSGANEYLYNGSGDSNLAIQGNGAARFWISAQTPGNGNSLLIGGSGATEPAGALVIDGSGNVKVANASTAGSLLFNGSSGISQDSSNLFWDATNHRLGVGTASPTNIFNISGSGSNTGVLVDRYAGGTAGPIFRGRSANGTVGSPTSTASGDVLGRFDGVGYHSDGTPGFLGGGADIMAVATENFSATASGSQLQFHTIPNTTLTRTTALTLGQDQSATFTGVINGNGSGLTTLNASNLSSGTVGTARLGSGSATSSTFLRGDGQWATPSGAGNVSGSGTTVVGDVPFYSNTSATAISEDSGNFVWDSTNHRLGVGVVPAKGPLDILLTQNATSSGVITNSNASSGSFAQWSTFNDVGQIAAFGSGSSGATSGVYANRAYVFSNSTNSPGVSVIAGKSTGDIRFFTGGQAATNQRMIIDSSGAVTINNLVGPGPVMASSGGLLSVGSVARAVTVITSSGTFTTPSDSSSSTVYGFQMVGGGGGSGGCAGTGAVTGGAGGGGYAAGNFTGISASTGITITVGTGGAGGSVAGGNGGGGNSTTIGSPVSVTVAGGGSTGGSTSASNTISSGGNGGSTTSGASSSVLSVVGGYGGNGYSITGQIIQGGNGGSTPLGTGGTGALTVTGGGSVSVNSFTGYGGGGGGCISTNAGSGGANGVVIITRLTP